MSVKSKTDSIHPAKSSTLAKKILNLVVDEKLPQK
jgi:hypothetical protein